MLPKYSGCDQEFLSRLTKSLNRLTHDVVLCVTCCDDFVSRDFSEATTKPGEGSGHHSDVRPNTEPDRGEEPGNRPSEPAAGPDPVRDGGTKIRRGPEGTGTE